MKEFTARVEACIKEGEYYEVVLDRTAFFPGGGGQYPDTGLLGDTEVKNVREKDGIIYHLACGPLKPGREITGKIDWDLRFMKMQQHSGEHIISGLVHRRLGYRNVGFRLGNVDCTMDFDGEITAEELHKIESLANEAVFKNLDVKVTCPSKEELPSLEYRSKIEIEGQVRLIEIPGYDICACCAPHVKMTGEIGLVKLTNVQRYKGGSRVTMLSGFRALADYGEKERHMRSICGLLSAKEEEASQAVKRLQQECAGLREKLAAEQKKLLTYRVREFSAKDSFVCLFEPDLEGEGPRLLMNMVLKQGVNSCAVFWQEQGNGWRYVMGSKTADMRALAKELNEKFSGRGGGKPEMVQGFLTGDEEALRAWIQKKVREHNE